jgi:hypothetical protein
MSSDKLEGKGDDPAGKEERNLWNLLPDVALIEIFLYLEFEDRLRVSQTCRRWAKLMQMSGQLWRELAIHLFDADFDKHALWQVRRHGNHTRILTITGYVHPHLGLQRLRLTAMTCFNVLRESGAEIGQLRIFDIDLTQAQRDEAHRDETVPTFLTALERFLRSQKQLRTLEIRGAKLHLESALNILETLDGRTWMNLIEANFTDFFHWDARRVYQYDRFQNIIGQFRNLRKLHLNYSSISDDVLCILGNNLSKTLESLSIKVARRYSTDHNISRSSWAKLHKRCQHLKVNFEFIHIYQQEEVARCLPPEVFLRSLRIWSGYDMKYQARIRKVVDYVTSAFQQTLGRSEDQAAVIIVMGQLEISRQ